MTMCKYFSGLINNIKSVGMTRTLLLITLHLPLREGLLLIILIQKGYLIIIFMSAQYNLYIRLTLNAIKVFANLISILK